MTESHQERCFVSLMLLYNSSLPDRKTDKVMKLANIELGKSADKLMLKHLQYTL